MAELPSLVREGPDKAIQALVDEFDKVLGMTGRAKGEGARGRAGHPGPASAAGVLATGGATNFGHAGLVTGSTSGARSRRGSASLSCTTTTPTRPRFTPTTCGTAPESGRRSSVSAIVGTGLGGGVVQEGRIVKGAAGMAGELGHMPIPMEGLLEDGQPRPSCNCGLFADAESVASLTGITRNLLPYWLTRFPGHELAGWGSPRAAKLVRGYAERGDEMALEIFRQQAMAIGRVFSIAAKFTDPDTYFVGGGVIEAAPHFRDWFVGAVRENT